MKKFFILLIISSFLFGGLALAQNLGAEELGKVVSGVAGFNEASLETRVGTIIASVLGMLGTVFLVLTIYAGVLWMTASGEEAKIEKAKEILKAAIIGLAIVLSAYTITYFVGSRLGAGGSGEAGCCIYTTDGKPGSGTVQSFEDCYNGKPEGTSASWTPGSCKK